MRKMISQSAFRPTDLLMSGLLLALLAFSFSKSPALRDTTQVSDTNSNPVAHPATGYASKILPRNPSKPETRVASSELPDFAAIRDTGTKKREFFNYMLPMVREANDKVRAERAQLLAISQKLNAGTTVDPGELDFIGGLQLRYRVNKQYDLLDTVDALLIRVDVVPASLVLAQAANESGWGTSRFARKANNMFGVWCFKEGCGLKPLLRDEGLTHEVARYDSIQESIEAYVRTINSNSAYAGLRDIRAHSRQMAGLFTGHALAEGLQRYSARGNDYVKEIQLLIRVNNLHRYTLPVQA